MTSLTQTGESNKGLGQASYAFPSLHIIPYRLAISVRDDCTNATPTVWCGRVLVLVVVAVDGGFLPAKNAPG